MKLIITVLVVFTLAAPAAADYEGWSDTGYRYSNKRSCCEAAILQAQDDSVRRCELAGGFPDLGFRRNSARGKCDWDQRQGSDHRRIYRCKGNAAVNCK